MCGYGKNVSGEEYKPANMTDAEGNLTAEGELYSFINGCTGRTYDLTEYVNDVNRQYTQVLTEETNKRVQTSYTYGNTRESGNSIWEDSRDCIANMTSYYQYNGHGDVTSRTNDDGMVTNVYQYTPFGQVTLGSAAYEGFYAYGGESYNPNTGLEYLRARYYDTGNGNFLTEDTYLGNLIDLLTQNRYSYVKNNPVNYVDPSGHKLSKTISPKNLASNSNKKTGNIKSSKKGTTKAGKTKTMSPPSSPLKKAVNTAKNNQKAKVTPKPASSHTNNSSGQKAAPKASTTDNNGAPAARIAERVKNQSSPAILNNKTSSVPNMQALSLRRQKAHLCELGSNLPDGSGNGTGDGGFGIRGIAGIAKVLENFSQRGGTDEDVATILKRVTNPTGWDVTEAAKEIEKIMMVLELPYSGKYKKLFEVDDNGEILGIYPHYVGGDDKGITLGFGHYVSPEEVTGPNKSKSEIELLYTYVPQNTSLDYYAKSSTEIVPGSDYMPIDVAYELLQSDIAFHLEKLKIGIAKIDEDRLNELNQRQLSALLLIRYKRGSLDEATYLVMNDEPKEEWIAYFTSKRTGKISDRHRAAIEIYFGADYADFYNEEYIVIH